MPARKATLYRMVLPDHVCPFGARARQLLDQSGFEIDEKILSTRMDVDAFKEEQGVSTTPVIFIEEERIDGCDDLERYLARSDASA